MSRTKETVLCFFFVVVVYVHCHKLVQLPEQKRCSVHGQLCCFYSFYSFFQTSGQKQHRSNLYLRGMPMTEPGQKLEIFNQSQPPAQTSREKPAGRFASAIFSQCLFVLLLCGSAYSMILSPNCRLKSLMTHLASPSFYSFRI